MIVTRKAEVKKIKTITPPKASENLALSLYGPVGFFTSEGQMYSWRYVLAVTFFTILAALTYQKVFAFQTEASYFTYQSCIKEGTSGIMADGRKLNDNMFICASWDYDFGTRLLVSNIANGKAVIVEVADRGPNKKLYKKGRKIDLSKAAFMAIADCKQGLVQVEVEVLK